MAPAERDLRLARRAFSRGWFSPDAYLAALAARHARPERSLLEILGEAAKIPPDRWESLEWAEDQPDPAAVPPVLGPYEILHEVGVGGAGRVYRAWDHERGRVAALKVLRDTDEETLRRLAREAKIAAVLEHPNITRIHEFRVEQGRPCLAMEFIEGETIPELAIPPREAAAICRDVARAVHFAHERGILHRDLKPANLMRDASGRVVVTDFGLARRLHGASTVTLPGTILGTPGYMSPEQASGDSTKLTARSDVYGLGATLFALLTGRPPFEGDQLTIVLHRVLTQDAPSPRRHKPGLPREIELVTQCALAHDPSRRYATMADFADDLDRFLDGRPVAAQPPSLWYRARRAVAQRPWLLPVGAMLLLVLSSAVALVLAGAELVSGRGERLRFERARAEWSAAADAERLGLDALRRGDRDGAEAALRRLREGAGRASGIHAGVTDGWLPAARLARLLGRESDAREALEHLGPADPAARLERAILDLEAYRERAAEARARFPHAETMADLDRRIPGLGRQRAGIAAEIEAATVALGAEHLQDPVVAAARARLLWWQGRAAEAVARIGDAFHEDARHLLGEIREAAGEWEPAERAYTEAIDWSRGHRAARESRARVRRRLGEWFLYRDAARARELIAGSIEDWEAAAPAAERRWEQALAHLSRGMLAEAAGEEGAPSFRRAAEDSRAAWETDLRPPAAANTEGVVHFRWGEALAERGEDPTGSYERAREALHRAIDRDPEFAAAYTNLGAVAFRQAERGGLAAEEEERLLEEGERALDAARRLDDDPTILINLASIHRHRAEARAARGEDPSEEYADSMRILQDALARESGPVGWNNLALTAWKWAEWEATQGRDPTAHAREAIDACGRSIEAYPGYDAPYVNLGNAHLTLGEWQARQGESPKESWEAALGAFRDARSRNRRSTEPYVSEALVLNDLADWQARQGEDPVPLYRKAIELLDEARRLNPAEATLENNAGVVHRRIGGRLMEDGQDPSAEFEEAVACFGRAIAANPEYVDARGNLGTVYLQWGVWRQARGEDPQPDFGRAVAAFDDAIARNPGFWRAHYNKGLLFRSQRRWREAVAAFEAAERIVPANAEVRRFREEAQAQVAGEEF